MLSSDPLHVLLYVLRCITKGPAGSVAPGLQPSQPVEEWQKTGRKGEARVLPPHATIFVLWRKSLSESGPVDGVMAYACKPSTQEAEYEASPDYTARPCLRRQIMAWRDGSKSRVFAALQEHLSLDLSTRVRKFRPVCNTPVPGDLLYSVSSMGTCAHMPDTKTQTHT